jgi:predicted hydrocarbon binding protein
MIPAKQKEMAKNLTALSPGRYHILYSIVIGMIGGEEIRHQAQARFGRTDYLPNRSYPTREHVEMVIYAVEQGVPAERLGRAVPKYYLRNNPEIIKKVTRENVIEIFAATYEGESGYDVKTIEIVERGKNRAVLRRKLNPMPCDLFKGAILGLFEALTIPCQCRETECQWKNEKAKGCVYEITWE